MNACRRYNAELQNQAYSRKRNLIPEETSSLGMNDSEGAFEVFAS
jgi:hypothetical protein